MIAYWVAEPSVCPDLFVARSSLNKVIFRKLLWNIKYMMKTTIGVMSADGVSSQISIAKSFYLFSFGIYLT